jgi:hypothetical protein
LPGYYCPNNVCTVYFHWWQYCNLFVKLLL